MITKDVLRQIATQQKQEIQRRDNWVKRDILSEISKWMDDSRIIVLTGVRRCGKSTILKQIIGNEADYCYVNFENERFVEFKAQDFEQLNEVLLEVYGNPKIYFFDEIQNIEKFELFVRRLQDQGKKIVITGSNASLLSSELGTRLTGRYKPFEVYPFSFSEFLAFKNISLEKGWFYATGKKVEIKKLFDEYMVFGGFPEYLKNKDTEYIRTIYENILYRDIVARYSIKRQKILKELVAMLVTNISSLFTYNSLKESLKLSNSITVKEYISYLNNSYLFFELNRFDYSAKKQLNSPKKIYAIDPALHQLMGLSFSENKGRVLENLVFLELKRRKKEIYYFAKTGECDFIVKERGRITEAIQACYSLEQPNREREINGLLEAMESLKLDKGLILTHEQEEEIKTGEKTIKVVPVWRWLLERQYLLEKVK